MRTEAKWLWVTFVFLLLFNFLFLVIGWFINFYAGVLETNLWLYRPGAYFWAAGSVQSIAITLLGIALVLWKKPTILYVVLVFMMALCLWQGPRLLTLIDKVSGG